MARWLILVAVVIVWTLALEFPVPPKGSIPGSDLLFDYKTLFGKSLHLGVYVALAALAAWVPVPGRYRWLVMFFLMTHAWGTEMLQELLEDWCNRGGKLSDVGIDIAGIAIGTALTWKRWTA